MKTEPTFLDLVRWLADDTMALCGGDCSPTVHRMEAAHILGVLMSDRTYAYVLAQKAGYEISG
jgi:hypothetical protein